MDLLYESELSIQDVSVSSGIELKEVKKEAEKTTNIQ